MRSRLKKSCKYENYINCVPKIKIVNWEIWTEDSNYSIILPTKYLKIIITRGYMLLYIILFFVIFEIIDIWSLLFCWITEGSVYPTYSLPGWYVREQASLFEQDIGSSHNCDARYPIQSTLVKPTIFTHKTIKSTYFPNHFSGIHNSDFHYLLPAWYQGKLKNPMILDFNLFFKIHPILTFLQKYPRFLFFKMKIITFIFYFY